MNVKQFILGMLILFLTVVATPSQIDNWRKLVALESTKTEVDKILGKAESYFETYAIYKTEIGKFHVWYSRGGCHKDVEGLQWNVPAQRLTGVVFYPKKSLPLEFYISNKENFKRKESPTADAKPGNRYLYTSTDEMIVFETISKKNSGEFVYTIELKPGKDKQNLLCLDNKIDQKN